MRRYIVISAMLLPFLPGLSQAAQNSAAEPQPWVFSSEESSTSSYLGVDIADVTTDRLNALKLKEEKGVEVTMVDQDAPAGKAGIKEHDVILTMNGTAVESGAQLRRMIHETPPGRLVTLGLSRDGQPMTVKVQLADKHKEFAMMGPKPGDLHIQIPEIHIPDIDIPSMNMVVVTSSARSGLMVENISPQLGEFFGVKNGDGVLVRSVEKGSRAEKAGFRAGDVVIKVNGQPVHDTSDFTHAVHARKGESVSIAVVREKKEQTLTLSLPQHKDSSGLIDEETFFGEPDMMAQKALELSKMKEYIAEMRPEMEMAAENSRKAAQEMRKSFCEQQREWQRAAEKQKREFRKQMEHWRLELNRMRGDWV